MAKPLRKESSKVQDKDSPLSLEPPPPSMFEDGDEADLVDEEIINIVNTLPPTIITNSRKRIEPEQVDQSKLTPKVKEKREILNAALIWCDQTVADRKPIPKYPMYLSWRPQKMIFDIEDEPVELKLSVCNRSPKIMYIQLMGFWNEEARLGASWKCFPRTRTLIAPGLATTFVVKATPREESPVPSAIADLQIATAHCKDTVVAYFAVPILVCFHNFIPLPGEECEGEEEEQEQEK